MICKSCGNEYSKITAHLSQSDCKYPKISESERELFEGLLLGDGTIPDISRTNRKNTFLAVEMVTPRFLEWLESKSSLFNSTRLKDNYEDVDEWNATYVVQTISIPEMSDMRQKWYPNGKKSYPDSLSLTPKMVKLWYCGDGGLNWDKNNKAYANIKCSNESDNPDKIIDMFNEIGFDPTFRQERVCFNSETKDFLDWIGKPLPGFEYKWENIDRNSYDNLKEISYE